MSDQNSELIEELRRQIKRFAQEKILPFIEEDEKEERFRPEIFQGLGELGLCGLTLKEEFGGADLKLSELCAVLEEVAKYSVSYAITLSVSTMAQTIIQEFGHQKQKEKYLPLLTSGKEIGAFCLSESNSGTDAASLLTTAKKVDGGHELTGRKMWITSGEIASTYIVMARTGEAGAKGISSFIIKKGAKGLSFGKKESKIGWKVSPTREVILDKCFVPEEDLLATEGSGFKIAMSALDKGRITVGAIAVGVAQKALEESIKYSLERKQFDDHIFNFQGIQFMLAEMATEIKASELLVKEAARLYDLGTQNQMISSMSKLKATDMAMKVTTDAVQILGGVGVTTEYPVERLMRDAKILQIVEGTNQIQKVIIAKQLKNKFSS